MVIGHNVNALNAYYRLKQNEKSVAFSLKKLSTGLRISSASDDTAGLAISEKMKAQIRGLSQAVINAQIGNSLLQTAEGALSETHSILQRMNELAVHSASGTYTIEDRAAMQAEVDQLRYEIDHTASMQFNGIKLIDGSLSTNGTSTISSMTLQIGANAGQSMEIIIEDMGAEALGISSGSGGVTATGAVNGGTTSTNGEGDALSGTASGDIASVSLGGSVGDKVVDGATITFDYGQTTALSYIASNAFAGGDLTNSTVITDPMIIISYQKADGTVHIFAANCWQWDDAPGHQTIDDAVAFFQDMQDADYDYYSDFVDVGYDSSNHLTFTIKDSSNPNGGNGVFFVRSDNPDIYSAFGIEQYNTFSPTTTSYVTLSNGTPADDQTIAVNADDTTFTVSSGNYMGMTVNLASGKTVSDLTSVSDGVSISQSSPSTTCGLASVTFDSDLGCKITDSANLTFTYDEGTITISNGTPADDQTISVNTTDTTFTVGSGNYKGMTVNIATGKTVSDLTSGSDGISITLISSSGGGIDISTQTGANDAITVINNAISMVSSQRAYIGAMQNRLDHVINNLGTTSENLTAAESRIRDADMAREMVEFTKSQVLSQTAQAMLAQINTTPQNVLMLLKQ